MFGEEEDLRHNPPSRDGWDINYTNNKNVFIRKESNGRFGFKVTSEILRHDQHTAIPGGRIREIRFFGLRTLTMVFKMLYFYKLR